ncbi:MAG TPA: hypothetical protein VNH18_17895 [Bryobacteraceae bacterium]|nr:hypothetical protein [Bryobacteraceae bacterium]
MKIDTEIRHVTKSGTNQFLELGSTPDEAGRLSSAHFNEGYHLWTTPATPPYPRGS